MRDGAEAARRWGWGRPGAKDEGWALGCGTGAVGAGSKTAWCFPKETKGGRAAAAALVRWQRAAQNNGGAWVAAQTLRREGGGHRGVQVG